MIRRHPFLFSFFAIMVAVFCMARLKPDTKEPERIRLDYSRPVYTNDFAIICPQSLFYDVRADHDANAIFGAFTAIFDRDAKVKALGCETLKGGIPVTAHRMPAPYDTFVSVGMFGSGNVYFTMEANLKNDPADERTSSAVSVASNESSKKRMTDDYEALKSDFQSKFSTLVKPSENLRWLPQPQVSDIADRANALLVTPYGPCVSLMGNARGYFVVPMDLDPDATAVPKAIIGTFDTESIASTRAEQYCHDWYTEKAARDFSKDGTKEMWFHVEKSHSSEIETPEVTSPPTNSEAQPKPDSDAMPPGR